MQSLLVRRLCHAYLRQLKISGQSYRQLSTVSNQLNISRRFLHQSTFCISRRFLHQSTCCRATEENKPKVDEKGSFDVISQLREKKQKGNKEGASKGPGWIMVALCAVGFGTLYYLNRWYIRVFEVEELKKAVNTTTDVLIGGEWELTNHHGKTMTDADFKGDWCIIYFGFCHCPDICPDEIEKIVEVTEILDRNRSLPKVRCLFITVDPDRDTPELIKDYLSEFSDKLIGLTGSKEQLSKVWRGFKVYHSIGPKDEDGDYVVDHSIITYLMNPDGLYEGHYPRSLTNIQVATAIEKKMNHWKKVKG